MNLTFRNTTTYQPDGSFIPDGYIFTVSSNGRQNWTNDLRLNNLTVSTFTLNSTFIVASTNTNNMVIFSSLVVSSTDSRNLTYSTLTGDSIITNNLTLNSNLNVGSTYSNLVQASSIRALTVQSLSGSLSSIVASSIHTTGLQANTVSTQTAVIQSSLQAGSIGVNQLIASTGTIDTVNSKSQQVASTLTTSSMLLTGSGIYSTLSGSSLTTLYGLIRSTLTVSSLLGSTATLSSLGANVLTVTSQLNVSGTAALSTSFTQIGHFSTLTGSTLLGRAIHFSTLFGSTLTLDTVVINSTLITSSFATGSLNFSTLVGSSMATNGLAVNSTLIVSTTESQNIVVNRRPTTAVTPAYRVLVEQGAGNDDNGLYIGNSNNGSDQGVTIGVVNQGFSFFGSYAKIQGKRMGSAGTTNLVLQPDAGKVGIGTTNPDALLDIHVANSTTPGTMFLYNAASGTNTTGGDLTIAAFNLGSAGSGVYYNSIRTRIPNGAVTSATRMDLCTPNGITDNTQIARLSIMPYTGYVGIGTTVPSDRFTVYGAGYGLVHTDGTIAVGSYTTAVAGLVGTQSNHPLGFFTNSLTTPQMTLATSGNVGIATTVPTNLLHIQSNATNLAAIRLTSNSAGWGSGMIFENTTATTGRSYGIYSDGAPGSLHIVDVTAVADRMVIDKTGQVGIGTGTPAATLDVAGGIISRLQSPALSFLGDVDGAKWLMKLGDYNLSFLSDNGGFTGFDSVTAFGRTFQTAAKMLGATGGMIVKGSVGIGTNTATYRITTLGSQAMAGTSTSVAPEIIMGGIRPATASVQNNVSFGLGLCGTTTSIDPYGRLDLMVSGYPAAGNSWGYVPNVTVMSVIGTGTVGIGTTAPLDTLDVNGALRVINRALIPGFNNTGNTTYPGVINLGGGYGPQIRSIYPNSAYTDNISLQFCTNQAFNDATLAVRMHIAAVSGNVGIGNVAPGYKLEVTGDARVSSTLLVGTVQSGFSQWGSIYSAGSGSNYIVSNDGTKTVFMGVDSSGYAMIGSHTNHDLVFRTNNAEKVRITAGGYMGVGVSNPSATIHVASSTGVATSGIQSTRYFLRSPGDNQDTSGTDQDGPWYGLGWSGISGLSGDPYVCLAGFSGVALRSGSGYLQLTGSGFVGMGITNPATRLHVTNGDASYATFGPNSTWSGKLLVGAGTNSIASTTAQVIATNGNLHLDAGNSKDIYIGYYANQGSTPNTIYSYGTWTHSGSFSCGTLTGSEVYTNNWFRVNGQGGLYWTDYGRGIRAADLEGASYGNVTVYGTGINTWNGYDINGRYTFMANGNTVGIHDKNYSWCLYAVNQEMYIPKSLSVSGNISAANLGGGEIWNGTDGYTDIYARLPGNILMMWGYRSGGGARVVNFPIAYASGRGPWTVQCTMASNGGGAVNVFAWTTSNFTVDTNFGAGDKPPIWWFSIGFY